MEKSLGYSIWNPHPPLWKKDTRISIPVELNVKSSQEIFVSLTLVPAEHCGRFWYQVWFQLDPLTFERNIPGEVCIELSISSWNFSLRFQFQKTPRGRFKEICISSWIFETFRFYVVKYWLKFYVNCHSATRENVCVGGGGWMWCMCV